MFHSIFNFYLKVVYLFEIMTSRKLDIESIDSLETQLTSSNNLC